MTAGAISEGPHASPPHTGPGGLPAAVRRALVARQLDEQIALRFPVGQRLRVLDVGLGRGAQALRLARAGHLVTGLDSDPEMLAAVTAALEREPEGIRQRVRVLRADGRDTGAHFLPGTFDVVLCHGVLMRLEEPGTTLAGLARVLAHGGLLSLLVCNGDAAAMRPGLLGDWAAAEAAFGAGRLADRLGRPLRADRLQPLSAALTGIGAPLQAWYGVRVFTGAAAEDTPVPDAAEFEQLLAVEERAGRTDPYRAVAALLHLCGVRG